MMRALSFGVAAVAALVSMFAYAALPPVMAIHWNAYGQADGFGPKSLALAIIPVVMVVLGVVFLVVGSRIEPAARRALDGSALVTGIFMLFVHGVMIAAGLGWPVAIERVIPFGISLLFAALGPLLRGVAPNRFVGIRTPWTMRNPEVWRVTHEFTARLFAIGGLLLAAACVVGVSFWVVFAGFMLLGFVPMAYSLVVARRLATRP